MLKNIKNCNSQLMILLVVFIQTFSLTAHAAGTCFSDKLDISDDTKKISQKLAVKYGTSPIENAGKVVYVKDNVDEIYDEQELKVDRSLIFLNQVIAVGVITDAPMATSTGYGTAILISPCHVLTNAHVIPKGSAQKGQALVYISLGQNTCDRPSHNVVAQSNWRLQSDDKITLKEF